MTPTQQQLPQEQAPNEPVWGAPQPAQPKPWSTKKTVAAVGVAAVIAAGGGAAIYAATSGTSNATAGRGGNVTPAYRIRSKDDLAELLTPLTVGTKSINRSPRQTTSAMSLAPRSDGRAAIDRGGLGRLDVRYREAGPGRPAPSARTRLVPGALPT